MTERQINLEFWVQFLMGIKYKITQFSDLNINGLESKKISMPTKDEYKYIYMSARNGNEMAAAQLLEWVIYCSPGNAGEEQVYDGIYNAYKELFVLS